MTSGVPNTPNLEKIAKAAEEVLRRELAVRCYNELPQSVKDMLEESGIVTDDVQELLDEGNWTRAANALAGQGQIIAAAWLRLETPNGLDH